MNGHFTLAGLSVIIILTLVLPLSVRKIEEELETFLFAMGVAAATISGVWSGHLVMEALKEPLPISATVLVVGFIFKRVRNRIKYWLAWLVARLGLARSIFIIVAFLGFTSSVLTAIIASIVLAEVMSALKLEKSFETRTAVYACYAIGLGAALTPLGEPLSTLVVAKLKAPPHNAGFFYLIKMLGLWVAPGVLLTAFMASLGTRNAVPEKAKPLVNSAREHKHAVRDIVVVNLLCSSITAVEDNRSTVLRAAKVYLFVMALIFLGAGLAPLAERFVPAMPTWALYWLNSVSAVLDNATLAAAEVTPSMSDRQMVFVLMGLLISGGMLIPGNIPNIVSASRLKIRSGEWARAALPYGAALMLVYFVLMTVLVR